MELDMPAEIWEYTPTGRTWEQRFAYEPTPPSTPPVQPRLPVRVLDVVVLGLIAAVVMWFAHQLRTEKSQPVVASVTAGATAPAAAEGAQSAPATAAVAGPKSVSYRNCKLMKPGLLREQTDGLLEHMQLHPYVYTTCDGVEVTLWSEMR